MNLFKTGEKGESASHCAIDKGKKLSKFKRIDIVGRFSFV